MYGHSGYNKYFGNYPHGVGPMPMHSVNNSRVNGHYFINNGNLNLPCPVRKVHCGELRLQDAGFSIEICGRIQHQRLGRFLSLRDETGITQLVVPDDRIDIQRRLRNMPPNSFLILRGFVTARPEKSKNEKMPTGEIEVLIENLVSVYPKRKKDDGDSEDEGIKKYKKKASKDSASLKLTSEELSKCSQHSLIKHFSERSHTCGELGKHQVGKSVTLCGWVSAKRIGRFVVLKDGYGSIQIVPEITNVELTNQFQNLQIDSIIVVKGVVSRRPPGHENMRADNGSIEVLVQSLTELSSQNSASSVPKKEPGEASGDGNDDNSFKDPFKDLMTVEESKHEDDESAVPNPNTYCSRTHTCGELNKSNVGQNVRLMGWMEFKRFDKFLLIRDRYGVTQLLIPETRSDLIDLVGKLPLESVIAVEGTVCSRPPKQENPKQTTGDIEISVADLKVLNKSKETLPFSVRDSFKVTEPLRLKYRYIDLRHRKMQQNLRLRSQTFYQMRKFLIEHLDFLEVETPTLFKRTPGGAQEFIVPTKTEGKYYSLVQSPQQFKQLLMVGAIDRYFQFARCYRDETITQHRQPEFTQLDIEMSFITQEDIINLIEDLLKYSWPKDLTPIVTPFPRLTYEEAMSSYGTDKPDLRFDWKIENLTDIFKQHKEICKGKININEFLSKEKFAVHAFVGRKGSALLNSVKKKIIQEIGVHFPSTKLYFLPVKTIDNLKSVLESLFCQTVAEEIIKTTLVDKDDVLFMAIGPKIDALTALGKIRVSFADYLEEKNIEVISKKGFNFLWVVDFPLFVETDGVIESCHHPFTQPHPDDEHLLETEPLKVRGLHYDLVLNGEEVGGGSVRIHDAKIQQIILDKILKINFESLSHLIDALQCGAPPHGGIALGLDRLIAIMCCVKSIKDVIAFPKGHLGQDFMADAPCDISKEEKLRYHLLKSS